MKTIGLLLLLFVTFSVLADYREDIGHHLLQQEVGSVLPDGSGVNVTQVEAKSNNAWMPDPEDLEFSGKVITNQTGLSNLISGHATRVGKYFYGNSFSIAPGISTIDVFFANDWIQSGFLRTGIDGKGKPAISSSRIANHSWLGRFDSSATNSNTLRRIDWLVATDEFIQVVGMNNGSVNRPLLASAFNVISVGRTDGKHAKGSVQLDSVYTAGRTRPDIVVPAAFTSYATPIVAAASALLVEQAHTIAAGPSTTNRNGDVIYNGERSEVIKAVLMAGADRVTKNTNISAQISDYRLNTSNQTANGLDKRYGAGQVNIYNSYAMIAAGEQNSFEDDPSDGGLIRLTGYDYDDAFGGAADSNDSGTYLFSTAQTGVLALTASLVWNIDIAGGDRSAFDETASLFDLDLLLFDVTGDGQMLFASSESSVDNSENIWTGLDSGREYMLQVAAVAENQAPFLWDYGLAWQIKAVPVPAAVWFFATGMLWIFGLGQRKSRNR